MPARRQISWAIEPHTKAKHEILRRYLGAWFPTLGKSKSGIYYVEGCCGPGRYSGGEDGSPIIALKVATSQAEYLSGPASFLFIDEDSDRITNLKSQIAKLSPPSNFTVQCICGKFDELFPPMFDARQQTGRQRPTFALIDPFGFSGLPFSFVQRMLKQEDCEVMINFMAESISRFLDNQVSDRIIEIFGTNQCIGTSRLIDLRKLYSAQLHIAAKFVRHFEMRDKRNHIRYWLFSASNHELGHLKIKEAMWSIDPMEDFVFSDRTGPGQLAVIGDDVHSVAKLKTILRDRFGAGKGVDTTVVRRFVENETPYLKKHMDQALHEEEKSANLQAQPNKVDGTRRNRGNFGDGVIVEFGANPTDQLRLRLF
jgi:three-Cys-motif partner protein